MALRIENGVIDGARQVASPNFDARPEGTAPELIVVHGISLPPGEFGGPWIERLFTNTLPRDTHPYFAEIDGLRVSSHVVIGRDGLLTQYVNLNERAWHAGQSVYCGREKCNDFSVGIELEGTDDLPYERPQYRRLAELVAVLCKAFNTLSPQRLVGHSDIAPGRKTDPGPAFDWPTARRMIRSAAGGKRRSRTR